MTLCALSGAGLVGASFLLNPLCFYLSPVALIVICFYSLTKRFTDYTHVYLGLALALAPVGAWLAVKGTDVSVWEILQMVVLAAVVVLWLVGFDIIYALQDYEFDRAHGLHSLVVAWGPKNALQAQRRRQRHFSGGDPGRGRLPGRLPPALKPWHGSVPG